MLFSKKADPATTPAPTPTSQAPKPSRAEQQKAAPGSETAMSVIAQGMRIVGDVECVGVLKIEGVVEGSVRGARQVLLGRQGEVRGDLHAREIVLGGRVDGTVIADERCEIQGTAVVSGDVHTKSIVVLEGGRINGAVRMDDAPGASAAAMRNGKESKGEGKLEPRAGTPAATPALVASR